MERIHSDTVLETKQWLVRFGTSHSKNVKHFGNMIFFCYKIESIYVSITANGFFFLWSGQVLWNHSIHFWKDLAKHTSSLCVFHLKRDIIIAVTWKTLQPTLVNFKIMESMTTSGLKILEKEWGSILMQLERTQSVAMTVSCWFSQFLLEKNFSMSSFFLFSLN